MFFRQLAVLFYLNLIGLAIFGLYLNRVPPRNPRVLARLRSAAGDRIAENGIDLQVTCSPISLQS
jgi:hypothetical protein